MSNYITKKVCAVSLICPHIYYYIDAFAIDPHIRALNFLMDEVDCSGTETRLIECEYSPMADCRPGEAAGVKCQGGGKRLYMIISECTKVNCAHNMQEIHVSK